MFVQKLYKQFFNATSESSLTSYSLGSIHRTSLSISISGTKGFRFFAGPRFPAGRRRRLRLGLGRLTSYQGVEVGRVYLPGAGAAWLSLLRSTLLGPVLGMGLVVGMKKIVAGAGGSPLSLLGGSGGDEHEKLSQ